jgi:hypothetical protein
MSKTPMFLRFFEWVKEVETCPKLMQISLLCPKIGMLYAVFGGQQRRMETGENKYCALRIDSYVTAAYNWPAEWANGWPVGGVAVKTNAGRRLCLLC